MTSLSRSDSAFTCPRGGGGGGGGGVVTFGLLVVWPVCCQSCNVASSWLQKQEQPKVLAITTWVSRSRCSGVSRGIPVLL